jgi:hypothetical protein
MEIKSLDQCLIFLCLRDPRQLFLRHAGLFAGFPQQQANLELGIAGLKILKGNGLPGGCQKHDAPITRPLMILLNPCFISV